MQTTSAKVQTEHDGDYERLEQLIAERVAARPQNLFTTDTDQTLLWTFYLQGIHENNRKHYDCHCCRQFIQRYGGLVFINDDGTTTPLVWPDLPYVPEFFAKSVKSLINIVSHAKVTGVFISTDKTWGTPKTGVWSHLCGHPKKVDKKPILWTESQVEADKKQDFIIMKQGLKDYPINTVFEAVRVLRADALDRSEKALGIAEWFLSVHKKLEDKKGRVVDNLLWEAVATAPVGYCHVRSTMISTLLDDLIAGMGFDEVSARWAKKMHPLRYQRPTAPVTDNQVAVAEKLVTDLGLASAFARRYATLNDVLVKVWEKPTEVVKTEIAKAGRDSIFAHLKTKKDTIKPLDLPADTVTWAKFSTQFLPMAIKLEVKTPKNAGSFYGLVTAADPDAPAIIQWDGLEWHGDPEHKTWPRNPASWYFYNRGSNAEHWNLPPYAWVECPAVFLAPHQWQRPDLFKHQGSEVFFALVGAKDVRGFGNGLFPEVLKTELRGIRSVLEQYSKTATVTGKEEGNANGIALSQSQPTRVRVTFTDGSTREFVIDRID